MKKLEQALTKFARQKIREFGLGNWEINLHFHAAFEDDRRDWAAWTDMIWEYMSADIHFNLSILKNRSETRNEETVCHELAHILLSPLSPEKHPMNEYVTTHLARILSGRITG